MFYPLVIFTCFFRAQKLLAALLAVTILNFFLINPAIALSEKPINTEENKRLTIGILSESNSLESGLQEVPPPGAVQQIRQKLAKHNPQLTLLSPIPGEILANELNEWQLVLDLKDWPLVQDPDMGIGPHLVIQIDDLDPIRISHADGDRIVLSMDSLAPGSHRLAAYLAFPWGEALKGPGTFFESRIHFIDVLEGSQPAMDQPWLTIASPSELALNEPLLIDPLIWNAPLQGLKVGDDRWRLRVTINGGSFLLDRQEAIWVKGLLPEKNIIHFELLDNLGNPITPFFNNKLRIVSYPVSKQPIWMHSKLSNDELSRFIGEPEDLDAQISSESQSDSNNKSILSQREEDTSIPKYEVIFPRSD